MLGYANIDLIARVSRLPGDGDRVTAERIETHFGGMAANAACAAAREEARPIFFGSVGNDAFGPLATADLDTRGVDTRYLSQDAPRTTMALILVTPQGQRAIVSEPTAYEPKPLRTYLARHRGPAGILYTDGYHVGWAAPELEQARRLGFRVYCDLDGAPDTYSRDELVAALHNVDIAQCSDAVIARLLPAGSGADAAHELERLVPAWIKTSGAREVILTVEGHDTSIPVPAVKHVVDTTGAGDALAGTTTAWLARGSPIETAVRRGVAAARRSVQRRGAR